MNFRYKFPDALKKIKEKEEFYTKLVQNGTKDPMDYHYMSYYSGLHNGFNLVWHVLDNHINDKEFDRLIEEVLQSEELIKS